jgi:glutamate racemase
VHDDTLDLMVAKGVGGMLTQTGGVPPHRAILGCTHYPLVEALFQRHLPAFTRVLSQPEVVADSLEDYLQRHPRYADGAAASAGALPALLLTTGDPSWVSATARLFWPHAPAFRHLPA